MKYSDLVAVMHQFRIGNINRVDMVAAIALWQRPVEIAKVGEWKRRIATSSQVPYTLLWNGEKDPGNKYDLAVEAVIR